MPRAINQSLLLRVGLLSAALTLIAAVAVALSVWVAETVHGGAAAVNQAGSLRMQSYRIAAHILAGKPAAGLIRGFDQRLGHPRLAGVIPRDGDHPLAAAYADLKRLWARQARPLLEETAAGEHPPGAAAGAALVRAVDRFAARVDAFVLRLERHVEGRVRLLGTLQVAALVLILLGAVLVSLRVRSWVMTPMNDLLRSAERLRQGDFSARAAPVDDSEFGALGRTFNTMAAHLSRRYEDLEDRIAEKTASLARSNRSLKLLYDSISQLQRQPLRDGDYQDLLAGVREVIPYEDAVLCLLDRHGRRVIRHPHTAAETHAASPPCFPCAPLSGGGACAVPQGHDAHSGRFNVALRDHEQRYGTLALTFTDGAAPAPWQQTLLDAIGRHIGIAAGMTRRIVDRRLEIMEERAIIAREMHDSLAHTLSYLKIQHARLRAAAGDAAARQADDALRELGEAVGLAYAQLRDLMATCRIRMDERGLEPALRETIAQLGRGEGVETTLHYHLPDGALSAHQEIHLLHIAREALSNALRHAGATRVSVTVRPGADDTVTLMVEDDGRGIDPAGGHDGHYGLSIMGERADALDGRLTLEPREPCGTRVRLSFPLTTAAGAPAAP